jgi:hypothetical protein
MFVRSTRCPDGVSCSCPAAVLAVGYPDKRASVSRSWTAAAKFDQRMLRSPRVLVPQMPGAINRAGHLQWVVGVIVALGVSTQ